MKPSITAVALATLLSTLIGTPPARADESDDAEITAMAKEHYKAGLDAYKAGNYDVAIKELKKAYVLKKIPALLLNIGATYRKKGDKDMAVHFYRKYLDDAPPGAKDRDEAEKVLSELGAPPRAPSDERTAVPHEWSHNIIDAAPPSLPVDVRVSMPVMKGVKVYLYYRTPGEEKFETVLMKRRGSEKVGRIPAGAMKGKSVQYYIEARDSGGGLVKNVGSSGDPNIVMIESGAPPQLYASVDEGGRNPRSGGDEGEGARFRSNLDDEDAGAAAAEHEGRKRQRGPSGPGHSPMFWAGVGLLAGGGGLAVVGAGVGFGLAKKSADDIAYNFANPTDSTYPASDPRHNIYFNNDPAAGTALADEQAQGKAANAAGIACAAIGGAMAVTGAVLIIVDQYGGKRGGGHSEKPAKPARDIENSWWLAPSVSPTTTATTLSLSGGFTF